MWGNTLNLRGHNYYDKLDIRVRNRMRKILPLPFLATLHPGGPQMSPSFTSQPLADTNPFLAVHALGLEEREECSFSWAWRK